MKKTLLFLVLCFFSLSLGIGCASGVRMNSADSTEDQEAAIQVPIQGTVVLPSTSETSN